jgi:hypothetical protein
MATTISLRAPIRCGTQRAKLSHTSILWLLRRRLIVTKRPKLACRACPGQRGARTRTSAVDRRRHSDRGDGRECAGGTLCRPRPGRPRAGELAPDPLGSDRVVRCDVADDPADVVAGRLVWSSACMFFMPCGIGPTWRFSWMMALVCINERPDGNQGHRGRPPARQSTEPVGCRRRRSQSFSTGGRGTRYPRAPVSPRPAANTPTVPHLAALSLRC